MYRRLEQIGVNETTPPAPPHPLSALFCPHYLGTVYNRAVTLPGVIMPQQAAALMSFRAAVGGGHARFVYLFKLGGGTPAGLAR